VKRGKKPPSNCPVLLTHQKKKKKVGGKKRFGFPKKIRTTNGQERYLPKKKGNSNPLGSGGGSPSIGKSFGGGHPKKPPEGKKETFKGASSTAKGKNKKEKTFGRGCVDSSAPVSPKKVNKRREGGW